MVGRDQRHAARQRFQRHGAQQIAKSSEHEGVGRLEQFRHSMRRDAASEFDPAGDTQTHGQFPAILQLGAVSGDDDAEIGVGGLGRGFDQKRQSFAGLDPSSPQENRRSLAGAFSRVRRGRGLRVQPVVGQQANVRSARFLQQRGGLVIGGEDAGRRPAASRQSGQARGQVKARARSRSRRQSLPKYSRNSGEPSALLPAVPRRTGWAAARRGEGHRRCRG